MYKQEVSTNKSVPVGTTSVQVSKAVFPPAERKLFTFVNTSTGGQVISVAVGQDDATAGEGIVLYPAGSYSEGTVFACSQGVISAISDLIGGTLAVYEKQEV